MLKAEDAEMGWFEKLFGKGLEKREPARRETLESSAHEGEARLRNTRDEPLEVFFEPWGMNHWLEPGEELVIRDAPERPERFFITWEERYVSVCGTWPGGDMMVYQNGVLFLQNGASPAGDAASGGSHDT